ncbi:hypothetical protein RR49_00739 [Microbacterium ginsengisoli]|uniref:Uncharacterized protein n=1 Tax=Microbacterium ginsengisoli TaxID=400772 RepID=A0A0F0M1N5_9MICO|nr:hypothetical protein RR49_00739 [Microbacterium ginsengisoli]
MDGARQVRPAGARHARGPAVLLRSDPRLDGGGVDARDPAERRGGGLRHAVPGRLDRSVPGGVAGADGAAPAAAAALVLRPRRRDRAHPAGADPGRGGASVRAPQAGPRESDLPAPEARAGARAHARDPDLPGAAHADGHGRRRAHRRGRRPHAAGDGVEAGSRAHRLAAGEALRRHGRARARGRRCRCDLREDPGVRELRVRRVALAVVRAAGLRQLVDQAALPGGVPRRAAARPADGVLLACDPHRRRPASWRRGAQARPAALGRRGRARAARRGGCRARRAPG